MWYIEDLKEKAKAALNNNYWLCVVVALVMGVASGGGGSAAGASNSSKSSSTFKKFAGLSREEIIAIITTIVVVAVIAFVFGTLIKVFVLNPLKVSCCRFFYLNVKEKPTLNELAYGFTNNYKNIVKVMFFNDLYIFLWSLLFIIPGIVKSYEFFMVPYLLGQDSTLSENDIFEMSKSIMDGNKANTFILQLSFIGWCLLGILTCGILLVFYVNPYVYCTMGELANTLIKSTNPGDYYDNSNSDYNGSY